MNVTLSPELEQFVADKVAGGMYHSAGEVVSEGLRLVKEQDALREMRLDELRREINVGIGELDRGESALFDREEIRDEAIRLLQERTGLTYK